MEILWLVSSTPSLPKSGFEEKNDEQTPNATVRYHRGYPHFRHRALTARTSDSVSHGRNNLGYRVGAV